jgi:two-component system sensor histidine kinase QseC
LNQPTLTRHLLAWTLGALVLVWGTFIILGYRAGQEEADEQTDGHLASVAALLLSYGGANFTPAVTVDPSTFTPELKAHDYQQSMSVVVWDGAGQVLTHTGSATVPAFGSQEGFATLALGEPAAAWRVFSRWDTARSRKVMVMVSVRERDDLAKDIADQIAEPGLWLLPVVALALGLAIRHGLQPLYQLSRDVDALDIQHAGPLPDRSHHRELGATVVAINTLMTRYRAALDRERDLANEFAHELRTPLAAVALHARALRELQDGAEREQTLARLEQDVARAGHVLTDLLALARASRAQWDEAAQPVDLVELARGVVADFAPHAHGAGHELALVASGPFALAGHPLLLQLALRNLVENALSHTPSGTHVEVQLDAGARWLQVCDDAVPAASAPARSRASVPHSLGLGLGHRVVEKIAGLHGARFAPVAQPGSSSCYRITFPAPALATRGPA